MNNLKKKKQLVKTKTMAVCNKLALVFTAIVVALSGMALTSATTFADDFVPTFKDLTIGVRETIHLVDSHEGCRAFYKFTPTEDGIYRIWSETTDPVTDPGMTWFGDDTTTNSYGEYDDFDYTAEPINYNFRFQEELEAGETYYFGFEAYGEWPEDESGFTYYITLEKVNEEEDPDAVHVEGITLEESEKSIAIGESTTLSYEVFPENADDKSVYWYSNKEEVATVDKNGKVTGIAPGTTIITVVSNDGYKYANCQITVKASDISDATVNGLKASYAYTGKAIAPVSAVKLNGKTLKEGTDYSVKYTANKNIGTGKVTITGKGNYTGTLTKTFKIVQAKQPVKVTTAKTTVKSNKVKTKAQVVSNAIKVTKAQGTVTYTRVVKGSSKYLTINQKSGKITVKKGTPKGSYKIKVTVKAAGNKNYKTGSKTVTATVVVK